MSKYVPTQVRCTIPDAPDCPCRFARCDREGPYCEVTRLAKRAAESSRSTGGPGLSESDALIQAFDQMAQFHREEAKRRAGSVSIEGGPVKSGVGLRVGRANLEQGQSIASAPGETASRYHNPSDLDSRTPAPRCIANIPTTRKKVAHQCRNRAKYGQHCALHATGKTAPDVEQFPAALAEPAADPFQW